MGTRDKETTGFSDSNYFYETSVACIDQLADFSLFPTGSYIDYVFRIHMIISRMLSIIQEKHNHSITNSVQYIPYGQLNGAASHQLKIY